MSGLCGALLAGGQSRRMGAPKAGVRLPDGRRLAEVALLALRAVSDEVVVVGHGSGAPPQLLRIADAKGVQGPLAGLLGLLQSGRAERYLVVPCDLPRLQGPLLGRLVREAAEARASVAAFHDGERLQPLPLLLPQSLAGALAEATDSGERRLAVFVRSLSPHLVAARGADARALLSANTPAALKALWQEVL
jgi:molybdenum cofactor guanylyltransferase